MTDETTTARPGRWVVETLRIRPARVPIGHSLRSALAVGVPFIIGASTDHIVTGMWVGLATLLLAAGEREGTYRLNFQIIAISTPIAAAGYTLGYVSAAPLPALMVLMALLALLMGLIAGLGPGFSVGGMQFLLVASIALGVEHIDWLRAIGLYLVGAAGYAALLAVEMLVVPARPQRAPLAALLAALAQLARARETDLSDGGDRVTAARRRAAEAQAAAAGRVGEFGWVRRRSSVDPHGWTLDSQVIAAADTLAAMILGERDRGTLAQVADRIDMLAAQVRGGTPGVTGGPEKSDAADSPLVTRLDALVGALGAHPGANRAAMSPISATIGSESVLAAARLALAFAVAVGAKAYFPFNHWFWVPLTVCLVMKPDFGSVFSRSILRVLGTVVGAAVATVVVLTVAKGVGYGIVIALLAATVPWLMMRSYALQALAITPIVILLVEVITPGKGGDYGWQRIAATAIGGVIVIVFGYLVWPHSRRHWVRQSFATAMDAIADQLEAGAAISADGPDTAGPAVVTARRTAGSALLELQQRLHRALAEPPPAESVARAWLPVVGVAEQLAAAVTVYTDDIGVVRTDDHHRQVTAFCAAIRDLGRLRVRAPLPDPDPALAAVAAAVDSLSALLPTQVRGSATAAPAQ